MADRPIIFSAPMILALLAGRKTVTRRILKPQPYLDQSGNFCSADRKGKVWNWGQNIDGSPCLRNFVNTEVRFAVGDRLYVRENHYLTDDGDTEYAVCAVDEEEVRKHLASIASLPASFPEEVRRAHLKLRPSIHMPRWASRMTLIVTEVRVERLQDISEDDAWREGCKQGELNDHGRPFPAEEPDPSGIGERGWECARDWFADLWEDINGDDAWDANPWVVAVSFEVVKRNIDDMPVAA
jgi:hypothetical protein